MKKYYRVSVKINDNGAEDFIISADSEKKAKAIIESFFMKLNKTYKNIFSFNLDACRVFYINGNYYTREELEDI